MSTYRTNLPQLSAPLFLTDGGLETSLIFDDGLELPDFAAFVLLGDDAGRAALERYFAAYVAIARRDGVGIVLETPTWRASADWAARLGYTVEQVAEANRAAVALLTGIRDRDETPSTPVVISGCVGPRGDGYQPGDAMTVAEARNYHAPQVRAFADAGADLVTAITMTNVEEAIGVAAAARAAGMPVVISFTVETDGTLPTGQALGDAVAAVDAATDGYPAYFMVNCAHPTHFEDVLDPAAPWMERIKGLRANASKRSHAELDEADELDAGDAEELAAQYRDLRRRHPAIVVVGGCCGTNHVHVEAISRACATPEQRRVTLSNGVTLSCAIQGPVTGPAMVLVHGWPDSWRSYEQVLAALPTGIRAVAVSLRGFGESDRPDDGYEPRQFAADIVSLMDGLGIEDAVLVGHSIGRPATTGDERDLAGGADGHEAAGGEDLTGGRPVDGRRRDGRVRPRVHGQERGADGCRDGEVVGDGRRAGRHQAGHGHGAALDGPPDVDRMRALAGSDDPWTRASRLHFTGSAFVVHPPTSRVLLRWHARQDAWLQVGGHADPGEDEPLSVAQREAREETALVDLVPWPDDQLLHVVIVSVPANATEPDHDHADLRFVLATQMPDAARPEQSSGRLRWLSIADAMALTSEANVRESLARIAELFGD